MYQVLACQAAMVRMLSTPSAAGLVCPRGVVVEEAPFGIDWPGQDLREAAALEKRISLRNIQIAGFDHQQANFDDQASQLLES